MTPTYLHKVRAFLTLSKSNAEVHIRIRTNAFSRRVSALVFPGLKREKKNVDPGELVLLGLSLSGYLSFLLLGFGPRSSQTLQPPQSKLRALFAFIPQNRRRFLRSESNPSWQYFRLLYKVSRCTRCVPQASCHSLQGQEQDWNRT